jgi:fatty acid desaturase
MQYVHHFGTTRHVLEGARNLWIWWPVDLVWLHHNWHLTHHKHPTIPWVHLPRVGRRENPDRGFLPAFYLRMWRGPQRATEHVENRYAGRVIR